jgi:hypothetical protein
MLFTCKHNTAGIMEAIGCGIYWSHLFYYKNFWRVLMKRHFALDLISAVFFGVFLFFATIVGNVASFYISKAFN